MPVSQLSEQPAETTDFYVRCARPWSSATSWQEVNQTLDYLLWRNRSSLVKATELARVIQSQLETMFPLLDELCAETCPWCPDPCCGVATVWIDFQDLLFLHLSRQKIPPLQLQKEKDGNCRYSGPRGCLLPRLSRPWVCTWYLCPPQTGKLRSMPVRVRENLKNAVRIIKTSRKAMETEFIFAVS